MYHVSIEMNAAPAPPPNASPVVGAVNAVTNAASGAINAVAGAVNAAAVADTNVANRADVAANNMFQSVPKNNTRANNKPMTFNSLIPLGNSSPPPTNMNRTNNAGRNGANNAGRNAGNAGNANVGVNQAPPTFANFSTSQITSSPLFIPLSIFAGLVVVFLVGFSFFNAQIKQGYEYVTGSFQQSMGLNSQPAVMASVIPSQGTIQDLTIPPMPPQDMTIKQQAAAMPPSMPTSIVEKILPPSGGEVFNISQNKFTYYDAQPLCKALGAELATYEQVKDAWSKGADWCNYGWVKGQMAVYPTQKETYDKLQAGPDDERGACGTTGINGGYFDNPEMLYGVNCYGNKPSQSAHDEEQLMDEGKIPKSPETLKVDRKVNEFKKQADSLYVKPFNDAKWYSH